MVTETSFEEADCLLVFIKNSFSIISLYRSSSFNDTSAFMNSLTSATLSIKISSCVIVVGDINLNMSENVTTLGISANYLCLLAELYLKPKATNATRGDSCLDYVHVSPKHQATSVTW